MDKYLVWLRSGVFFYILVGIVMLLIQSIRLFIEGEYGIGLIAFAGAIGLGIWHLKRR